MGGQQAHLRNGKEGKETKRLTFPIGIQLANHDIGRMTDNSAEDTSNVTTQETHTSLCQLAVALLWLTHGLVDHFDCFLKGCKFGHSVRDLTRPQRVKTLVKTAESLLGDNATPALTEVVRIGRQGGLHANLDGFHRAQRHIGEEFGGSTGAQEDQGAIGFWEKLIPVQVLEVLIKSILAGALERVSYEGGRPAEKNTAEALLGED